MPNPTPTKIKEFRPKPPPIGGGGHTGLRQFKVRELAEGETLPPLTESVPTDTPVSTDWEDEN